MTDTAATTFDFFSTSLEGSTLVPHKHSVRIACLDGSPWFVVSDVCRALGLKRHADGSFTRNLGRVSADEKRVIPTSVVGGGRGNLIAVLSESGLYKLVLRADKPEARAFQEWVTREVLPAIRRTGGYRLQGVAPRLSDLFRHSINM